MTTKEVIGKRKRVSKNKKKSWRKHSDIKDVEEFMEDQRMQERTGGLVAEKTNEELFFVEKQVNEDDSPVPRKRRKREEKTLKCHSLLQGNPHIKPVRLVEHKKTNNVKRKCPEQQAKIQSGMLSKNEKVARQQKQQAKQQRLTKLREKKKVQNADYDLWDTCAALPTANVDEHYLKVTKKSKPKAPSLYLKKPSGLPAVEVAHPGASYNPAYEDHQELLQKALVVELDRDKKEKRLERSLDAKFPTIDQVPTMATWLQEMGSGLFDKEEGESGSEANESEASEEEESGIEEEEEEEESEDRLSVNPPVRREDKKTVKQRRKENERKEKEKQLTKEKKLKAKKNELFRLKSIKKEVKGREEELKKRLVEKAELQEKNKDQPKKLGKMKYEEPSLEIKLSDEVEGSLRLLKPEGHLLNDRFKSLQKRNVIEARERAKVEKKYKRKQFEKKSHKEVGV